MVRESAAKHSRKYRLIGQRLIRTLREFEDIRNADVRIAWLSSQKEKRKNRRVIYGECRIVPETYRWCCPYDFFITVYEPNIGEFTDDQVETLIRHELHHVGIDYGGEEPSFYVVPHDVEEFWEIIDEKGLDWDRGDRDAARGQSEQP